MKVRLAWGLVAPCRDSRAVDRRSSGNQSWIAESATYSEKKGKYGAARGRVVAVSGAKVKVFFAKTGFTTNLQHDINFVRGRSIRD